MIFYLDTEEPSLNCSDVTIRTDFGQNFSSGITFRLTATDNVDGNVSVNCSHSSNDNFPFGETDVTCEASDVAGNIGSCDFVVTVTGMAQRGSFLND